MKWTLALVGLVLAAGGMAAAEPVAKPPQQADVSVRGRLQRAIDTSRTLAAKGQRIKDDLLRSIPLAPCERTDRDKPLLFPRTEEVEAYMRDRPWASDYAPNPANLRPMRMMPSNAERWPTQADAPELRALLEDKDPAMRCVTAEALATLHQPEDVARIGRLLKDDADGLPVLGWNSLLTALPVGEQEIVAGGLQRMRSWHNRTVAATASGALKLMAGVDLTAKDFDTWWKSHSGGRNCAWYWQQRLTRELAAVEALTIAAWQEGDEKMDLKSYKTKRDHILAQRQQRHVAVCQAVAAELAQLPAEIEAKIRLCAINDYSTSLGVGLDEPLMGSFLCPRIRSDRLLELLERKNLWEDVDWSNECYFNNLAIQLVGRAEMFFTREHLPRLRAVMDREWGALWWSGRAALVIGISHLLPATDKAGPDALDTRDGWLRSSMRSKGDLHVRTAVAEELIRVALPGNRDFLKNEFLAEQGPQSSFPDLRQSIIRALGRAPLTVAKRELLLELVLDDRFIPLWTQPNRRMGDDMYRQYAIQAVNAHAGRELLTDQDKYALMDPAKLDKTLAEVRGKLATLRRQADAVPSEPTTLPGGAAGDGEGLRLRAVLGAGAPVEFLPGQAIPFAVQLVNASRTREYTVVKPGDGSESGWREPHVYYTAERFAAEGRWTPLTPMRLDRCKLFDGQWQKDVVTLNPGESLALKEWLPSPSSVFEFQQAGRYRIRVHYAYRGGQAHKGAASRPAEDLGGMKGVEPFEVVSAPVEITVKRPLNVTLKVRGNLITNQPARLSDLLEIAVSNDSDKPISAGQPTLSAEGRLMLQMIAPLGWGPTLDKQNNPHAARMDLQPGGSAPLLGAGEFANGLDGSWTYPRAGTLKLRAGYTPSTWKDVGTVWSDWVDVKVEPAKTPSPSPSPALQNRGL